MKEALVRFGQLSVRWMTASKGPETVSLLRSPMLMLTGDCHFGIAIAITSQLQQPRGNGRVSEKFLEQ
jgi:hypothetical protein